MPKMVNFGEFLKCDNFELFSNNVNLPLNPASKTAVVSPKIRKKNGEIKLVGSFLLSLVGVVQILAL